MIKAISELKVYLIHLWNCDWCGTILEGNAMSHIGPCGFSRVNFPPRSAVFKGDGYRNLPVGGNLLVVVQMN